MAVSSIVQYRPTAIDAQIAEPSMSIMLSHHPGSIGTALLAEVDFKSRRTFQPE